LFPARGPPPHPKERKFPTEIVHKSARATIYESENRGERSLAIAFHSEGERRVLTRRGFDDADPLVDDLVKGCGRSAFGATTPIRRAPWSGCSAETKRVRSPMIGMCGDSPIPSRGWIRFIHSCGMTTAPSAASVAIPNTRTSQARMRAGFLMPAESFD
jgi:hypothetical protein